MVFKFDPSQIPVLTYGVSGMTDSVKLRMLLDNQVAPILESADGVAAVSITGGQTRAIMVEVDPAKLRAALEANLAEHAELWNAWVRISLTLTEKVAVTKAEPVLDGRVLAIGSVTWPDGRSANASMVRSPVPSTPEAAR